MQLIIYNVTCSSIKVTQVSAYMYALANRTSIRTLVVVTVINVKGCTLMMSNFHDFENKIWYNKTIDFIFISNGKKKGMADHYFQYKNNLYSLFKGR